MWLYWWTPLRHTRYSLRKLTKQKKEKHKACVRVDDNNIERTNQSVMHNWRAQIRAAHQTRTSNKRPSTHRWLLCMTQVAVMHWYRMSVWPWSAVWSHLWSYRQDHEWGWTVRTCPRMRWKFEMAKSQPPISGCNSYKWRSASHRKKMDIIMDNKNRLFVCWNFNVSGRFWYLIHVRWAIYWHPHSRSIAVNYTYDSHIIYVMTYPTIHGPAQRPDPTRMIPTIQLPTCNMGCRFGSNSMRIHVWTVNQPSNNCIHLCNRRKYIQCKRH